MKLPDVIGAMVAVDTETSGVDIEFDRPSIVSIARAREDGSIKGCSYAFDQGWEEGKTLINGQSIANHVLWDPEDQEAVGNLGKNDWNQLMQWLSRQYIVGANFKFDLHMLRHGHREWGCGVDLSSRLVWDVNIATMLLEPRESVALKEAAARAYGIDAKDELNAVNDWFKERKIPQRSKDPRKARRYDLLPWDLIEPYATADAVLTLRMYYRQRQIFEEMGDPELRRVFDREMALARVLFQMEKRGIGFDADGCAASAVAMQSAAAELKKSLPFDPKIGSAKEFFFGVNGGAIPHMELTETGKPRLDKEVVMRLVEEEVKWAEEYQRLSGYESALSKWYTNWPKLVGPDGRIRTNFNQTNVRSGRLSVSRVQLQAIPHDNQLPSTVKPLRQFFHAKEGASRLWELDLSQAEVRVAAHYARCKPMVQTLRMAGADVHGATAKMVFGVDEESEDWFAMRQVAKRLTFGMLYGAGARTIRAQIRKFTELDPPQSQVEEWVREYRQTYPQFGRLSEKAQNLVEDRGYIKLKGGRKRWFQVYEPTHKAFNAIIQGSVAEVMKEWMIDTENAHPGVLLLQIHDSLVLETANQEIVECIAAEGEKLFCKRFNYKGNEDLWIDFRVDSKVWEGPVGSEADDEAA